MQDVFAVGFYEWWGYQVMNIRTYLKKDASALSSLMARSIDQVARKDYNPDQIRVWLERVPCKNNMDKMTLDGRLRLCVVDDQDDPVAFADLDCGGQIVYFFCAPEIVRRGFGTGLLKAIEKAAKEKKLDYLYVEASQTAKGFFLSQGYALLHKREFFIKGVAVYNWAMQKKFE